MSTVLVLARELPFPPNAGDRIVTYGFLCGLAARGHEVHLLAYGRAGDGPAAERLQETCASVVRVPRPESSLPPTARKLARAGIGRSDVMEMFSSTDFRNAAASRIRALAPAVVLAQHPYMGQVFREPVVERAVAETDARLVTNAHVIEYAAHRRQHEHSDDPLERAMLTLEIPRLRRAELAVYEAADRTLVLGEEDREELRGRVSGPVTCQRVALDVESYTPSTTADHPNHLLFFGSYDWFPNEDAVSFFCESVFPEIRAARPATELVVAGRGAPPAVRALGARPGITVLGEVEDLASLVRSAAVVVAPLRVGGGVRLKVLESMAWGTPVVTSGPGFEGVVARPGEDLLVAADWREFVTETVGLLDDPDERRRIAENARQRIEETYSLSSASGELAANLGLD